MNQKTVFAQRSFALISLNLIFFAACLATRAQTVIPSVCLIPNIRSGTTTLASGSGPNTSLYINMQSGTLPENFRAVINPGGATEETIQWVYPFNYSSGIFTARQTYSHNAGETVKWFTDAAAVWSYNNTSNSIVTIPIGILDGNFFAPGLVTYSGRQPNKFLPGVHKGFSLDIPTRADFTWFLGDRQARVSQDTPECATITYQGRLTDGGGAANGTYDLQFTAYAQLTGGTPQSETIVVENAAVVNGIFTVELDFGVAFYISNKAKYLDIGVRPGTSTEAFISLQPRQPITAVPFAVNAQTAANATRFDGKLAAEFLQISPDAAQAGNFNVTGNGAIGGSFNVAGNGAIGGNLTTTGTITSGCRAGFTAFAGGRLCVSAMKPAALFLEAIQSCANDSTRVGNSGDVMLTLGANAGFNYFGGLSQGWLADNMGNNFWGTWKTSSANADFAGASANGTATGLRLPYRCVY